MEIGITGVGHTQFGKSEKDVGDLMLEATMGALSDANTKIGDVDAIYVANFSSGFESQCHLPAVLSAKLGVDKEITRVESACAAGGVALKQAAIALESGLYKNVLVVGVEKMTGSAVDDATKIIAAAASKQEMLHGATFPSLYALMARAHFAKYGSNEEHLAKIAVKNHKNALSNPLAQFRKEVTVEDVLNSKVVASPIKLLDCSPITDGAAAVLVSIGGGSSGVNLVGIGHDVDSINIYERKNIASMPAVSKAAEKAFKMAGINVGDVNVTELHDCFTIAELIEMEELGFCKAGEGKNLIDEGRTEIKGDTPINPSGGLKAKGHPIGATGVSQVVEIVRQLRGECGERQVKDAQVGLCCNVGGSGATAVVSIFSR
jgi:acetyl-CoA C-acetyltransferase